MVSIIHSRDNAKITGKTSKNVKIKLQRNVAINIKKDFIIRDRIRTCNLSVRSRTRYPLRHTDGL